MLPEIDEYFRAMHDSDNVYDNAVNAAIVNHRVPRWNIAATDEERAAYYAAEEALQTAKREAEHAMRERQAKAYQALIGNGDKLIQWLMTNEHVRSYSHQRDEVLRALPMTREEMDDFGSARGWCGTYTDLYNMAEAAGVLPDPVPDLADVTPLARAVRDTYGGSTKSAQRLIKRHLPALLESARVKAAEAASQNDGVKAAETATA